MFNQCESLVKIDLSSFNTQNVLDMGGIFSNWRNLVKINLSSFNNEELTCMLWMFTDCINLTEIDLSSFKNVKVLHKFKKMIQNCENLNIVRLSRKNCVGIKKN